MRVVTVIDDQLEAGRRCELAGRTGRFVAAHCARRGRPAVAVGRDLAGLAFADVADKPAAVARNTILLLRGDEAGAAGAPLGVLDLMRQAMHVVEHIPRREFTDRRRRSSPSRYGPAKVVVVTDGIVSAVAASMWNCGENASPAPTSAATVVATRIVHVRHRSLRDDGLDSRPATVVVKSRGHLPRRLRRVLLGLDQIVEVDLPGLTSPMLNRFTWTRLPRPVIPLSRGRRMATAGRQL